MICLLSVLPEAAGDKLPSHMFVFPKQNRKLFIFWQGHEACSNLIKKNVVISYSCSYLIPVFGMYKGETVYVFYFSIL